LFKLRPKLKHHSIRNHSAESSLFLRRTLVVFAGIAMLVGVLLTNLYRLQVSNYTTYQTRSNANRISVQTVPPNRGLIYDRNGEILAENIPVYSLQVIVKKTQHLTEDLNALTKLLSLTRRELARFKKNNFRSRAFKPVIIKDRLTQKEVAIFTANQHRFKGFSVQAHLQRHYPFGDTFTHVLGYIAKINARDLQKINEKGESHRYRATRYIGKLGIEKYYESILHGEPGRRQVEVDSWGKVIRTISFTPPVPGKDIRLNLDIKLQLKAQELLAGRRGSIIIMDVNNGEVLALVSSPSYDPNLFVSGISSKKYKALLESPDRPLINRATQGRYPPASTIKPQMALLALNENEITEKTVINDPGWWIVPGSKRRFRDWKLWGHGKVDVVHAIEQSCDTFFYEAAYKVGIDRIQPFMKQFGFGKYSGLDINEETRAIMPSRQWKRDTYKAPWYDGDTISIGIGQGYWTATPIQLVKATAALATHGKIQTPKLFQSIVSNNDGLLIGKQQLAPIVLKHERYWDTALSGMFAVTSKRTGTAHKAFMKTTYTVAGKSGTAQVINMKEGEKYDANKIKEHHRDNAMFVAFAPFKKPQIAGTIILENAGGGSSHAAPVLRGVFDQYFDNEREKKQLKLSGAK